MRLALFLVFALIISFFAVLNATPVVINLQVWQATAPLSAVILLSTAAGALLASILLIPRHVRGFWQTRGLRAKVRRLETEIGNSKETEERLQQEVAACGQLPPATPSGATGSEGPLPPRGNRGNGNPL